MIISVIVAAVLVIIDQIAKYMALTKLKPIGNITFIKGFMDFTFVENRGAAFGILNGQTWLLLLLAIAICVILIVVIRKLPHTRDYDYLRASFVLILAGAVGNIIDRVARGYVTDFFEFTFFSFPVFNMADIYVVVGTIAMAFIVLFVIKEEKDVKEKDNMKDKSETENGGIEDADK
ncbi:Lipoprotein signal peptidase [bioreactor metagenome]|uniref:Lipoprotein signal peptidase n=1 Tax=bioreactor metagenome TaxID=1076179 RepID=A0A645AW83_9ZZZZ|nr:signal peptidase II [Candidatus Metalachnospira sp.]